MWLVVYKQNYYPSVFECSTEDEAINLYNKIKKDRIGYLDDDQKLYMSEVERHYGNMDKDVDWYLEVDSLES